MVVRFVLAGMLALWGLGAEAAGPVLAGQVTRVADGDSLWLTPDDGGPAVEVRLLGIDAPETCQTWGVQAKAALDERLRGHAVTVKTSGRDSYGRTLGTVYLENLNVNKWMVQEGHAWSTRYKYDRGPYVADERMAKALSRGFNGAGGAVNPRDFRRTHGPCTGESVAIAPVNATSLAAGATTVPTPANAYRCDGRTRCSQMKSCAEAKFFLKNCPGVQMDGDNDGVPCERQWCQP